MSYNNKILFFFNIYKNFNYIYFKNFNGVGEGNIGNYYCGDVFSIHLIFYYFNLSIINFKNKVYGCGSALSAIFLGSFYLINKFYYKIPLLKNNYISKKLKLPIIKYHCSILFEEILYLCLSNYKNNYIVKFF